MADEDVTESATEGDVPEVEATEATLQPSEADVGSAEPAADKGKTLAEGATPAVPDAPQAFPDNWQQLLAGEDKKALKTLERFASPQDMARAYAELRAERDSGKYIRRPASRATKEEMAEFRKAIGAHDEPEAYLENLKLSNDRVLGEDDKPIAESFVSYLHDKGVALPQDVANGAIDWYLDVEQAKQEQQAEADAEFHVKSAAELKHELGGDYAAFTNGIPLLFRDAPETVRDKFLAGRTADGHLFGDDPEIVKFLGSLAKELYPAAGMYSGDMNDAVKSLDEQIAAIENDMRSDRAGYFRDQSKQDRYQELLTRREQIQQRGNRAA